MKGVNIITEVFLIRQYLSDARGDLSQGYIAKLARISRQYLNALEIGKKGGKITLFTGRKLARALNMPLEQLCDLEMAYQAERHRLMEDLEAKEKLDNIGLLPSSCVE
jgi:transcriptional regulator with XRE-family HTH domain